MRDETPDMARRYLLLVLLVLCAAALVGVRAHAPRAPRVRGDAPPPPRIELLFAVEHGRLSPEVASVPQGTRVRLLLTNLGTTPANVRLAGYEDRVSLTGLLPRATRTVEFLADRPGDDFAWFVEERPVGRFAVTGSHLLEGHR